MILQLGSFVERNMTRSSFTAGQFVNSSSTKLISIRPSKLLVVI